MNEQLIFGVMTDCQYADADDTSGIVAGSKHHFNDNRFRLAPHKLQEAVATFNSHELDFVIHLGDFVDRHLSDVDVVSKITDALKAPLIHVLGNHDFMGSEGRASEVVAKFGLEKSYYSQTVKGYRLIVLDTNELGVIKYEEGTHEWQQGRQKIDELKAADARQAYDWNGGLGELQLDWLRNELQNAGQQNQKAILFSHHPVFPPNPLNALDDKEVLTVIDQYADVVVAYVNGHNHVGAYGERNGKPYITVPGMLQGETNSFGIVTVNDSHILIDGYSRMIDMSIERR